MSIRELINENLKQAMRTRDKQVLETLRLINAAIKQIEVDERITVDEARMLVILDKLCKQRKESIAQYEKAGRTDLVDKEQAELSIIEAYLPEPLSDDEINALVSKAIQDTQAATMQDMGKVMAILKPELQGRADMGKVSQLIRSKLT
ncbi:GatB/YqeY domain-containing protein [Legionella sp. W05-934-2]|jgi:uncharacterized protein YqeY|uniref:GatB/YqeY domain-containing protein n=1 Tax=Legionella sp. W05-934-2 TaxID=1198649 RepID=UPI0034633459